MIDPSVQSFSSVQPRALRLPVLCALLIFLAAVAAITIWLIALPLLAAYLLLGNLILLSAIIWKSASSLNRADGKRERMEAEAQDTEAKFKTIAEGIPQLVWTALTDGSVDYASQRWHDFTGLTAEQTLGHGWVTAVHPEDLPRTLEDWGTALHTRQPVSIEYRLKRKDGSYRWHLVRGLPIKSVKGKNVRWLGTLTDIEDQKEAQDKIQKALSARNDLLSVCSHELRTPVAAMKLQTQMTLRNIRKANPSALEAGQIVEWLSQTDQQLDRLTRLIEEMLDFSRVNMGRLTINKESFDLAELLEEMLVRLAPKLEAAGCGLESKIERPTMVSADRFRLEQVITNILGNAIQYAAGKPIHVRLFTDQEKIMLEIQDDGMGIAEHDLERIFEPYERAVSPHHVSGLGLGLYISRQIVESHQGTLRASSKPGQGARFIIELPRLPKARLEIRTSKSVPVPSGTQKASEYRVS